MWKKEIGVYISRFQRPVWGQTDFSGVSFPMSHFKIEPEEFLILSAPILFQTLIGIQWKTSTLKATLQLKHMITWI